MKPDNDDLAGDPIVDEIRAIREAHAAKFDYDIDKIFADLRRQQAESGREYVRYPARRTGETPTSRSPAS